MNKNAIQKFAIWARNELIDQVKQRAFQYGISDKGHGEEHAEVIAGRVLSNEEKQQRYSFVVQIKEYGYQQAVEEVAYTWFNRFVALRFMEVNDYLPTHVRVFSDANGDFNPEILKEVLHLDLPNLDKVKVSELLNANKTEELYRYLLLAQCNALNDALPEMFEKLGSYTEMLLPNNILKPDGVPGRLVTDISEEDWRDAVQIIGWMYQYYNTEPKQAVFDGLKKNVKISKEKIPAATQLFTPDWIVRYMVENSLGRLWLESHPNSTLREGWKYYLDEAEQTPEVAERLHVLRMENAVKSPEDIKVIDPCMGSGHILVYAFDVLMQIYTSEGYSERDAAKLILEKNLYGLEIDRRAYQLAYFALMMKARQYNRRVLTLGVRPQVYEPTGYTDGIEYGSLVRVDKLEPIPEPPKEHQMTMFDESYDTKMNTWNFRRLLAQKYDVVVTNPPYMGSRKSMNPKLKSYVVKNYPDSKSDLYACFIERCLELSKIRNYVAMITQQSFMFTDDYKELRHKLLGSKSFINMLHLGVDSFPDIKGEVVQTTSFILSNRYPESYLGVFVRLVDYSCEQKATNYNVDSNKYFASSVTFHKIKAEPISYWLSESIIRTFSTGVPFEEYGKPRAGITTGDNDKFLRFWHEVQVDKIGLGFTSVAELHATDKLYIPYNKGGPLLRWYGNNDTVIMFDQHNYNLLLNQGNHLPSRQYYCLECVTWSDISGRNFAARYCPKGFVFDVKGSCGFPDSNKLYFVIAFLNSKLTPKYIEALNPTTTTQVGDLKRIPILPIDTNNYIVINYLSKSCVEITKENYDLYEISWDFARHPLISGERTVVGEFAKWERDAAERFDTLKANEEELNRIFIDIYGLQDELTPEVEDKDVTVRRADLSREIRSLISYAVGCMFGRYSLDVEGLAYAGGEWDADKYKTFPADKDNIIPISDDEYFDDDILGRFVAFVKTVYGTDTLEENLKFIADALGGKGTPREVIRNYFLNDFYKDHLKIYQKRPIYWLFDSGKKNGFKALIYMHRYSRDLLAKMRTDYVHEQQERYRTQLSHIASALNTATGAERARLLKQQDKLSEQAQEIGTFEEKVHHLADRNIDIDLDDGVKKHYGAFADVLATI